MNSTKLELEEEMDEKKKNVDMDHKDANLTYTNAISLNTIFGRELRIHDGSMSKESHKAGMEGIKQKSKHLNRVRSYQSQSDLEPHLII